MKKLLAFLLLFISGTSQAFWQDITAKSWLVADGEGNILQSENSLEIRSIASITKLMTVMIVLDAKQPLDEKIGPHTRRSLIQLAMVKSDNDAAKLLCKNYTGGEPSCIKAMNDKAMSLEMYATRFHEPTGLSVFNVSTAEDLIKLVKEASKYTEIVDDSKTSQIKIQIKKKWFIFNNTNPIIGKRHNFIVSKTGYIKISGGCIVMMLDTELGRRIVVLLGSKNTRTRIPEAEFIAEKF